MVQGKNSRIQELERDIISREEHYRQEVANLQTYNAKMMEQEIAAVRRECAVKVQEL